MADPEVETTRAPRPDRRVKVAVSLTADDGTTRRHHFHGRTKREARQRAEEARQRVAAGAPVRDADRTLSDWPEEWRQTFLRASDRAESTTSLYTGLTTGHVEPVIGHLRLDQLKPYDITREMLRMEEAGKAAVRCPAHVCTELISSDVSSEGAPRSPRQRGVPPSRSGQPKTRAPGVVRVGRPG